MTKRTAPPPAAAGAVAAKIAAGAGLLAEVRRNGGFNVVEGKKGSSLFSKRLTSKLRGAALFAASLSSALLGLTLHMLHHA